MHGLLAALCWPAFALGLLLTPSGWFHRDDRRTAVLLHRRHQMRGWLWVAFFLGIHVVVRALAAVVGDVVLILLGATLAYAAVVLTCIGLRRRELRPPEERRGYIRDRELPTTSWLLVRIEHREGLLEPVMPQVLALIAARVPPGAVVGAAPSYDQLERDLISIGFAPVPDARGRVALTVPTS